MEMVIVKMYLVKRERSLGMTICMRGLYMGGMGVGSERGGVGRERDVGGVRGGGCATTLG